MSGWKRGVWKPNRVNVKTDQNNSPADDELRNGNNHIFGGRRRLKILYCYYAKYTRERFVVVLIMTTAMTTTTTTVVTARQGVISFFVRRFGVFIVIYERFMNGAMFRRHRSCVGAQPGWGEGVNKCFKIHFKHCKRTLLDRSQFHLN